jgi:hypothetical protein
MKLALTALATTMLLVGCSTPFRTGPEPSFSSTKQAVAIANAPGNCFSVSQMGRHRIADSDTLYVRVGRREVYRVDMQNACLAGAGARDPLLHMSLTGADVICRPAELDLKVHKAATNETAPCAVKDFNLMSSRQVAALPRAQRP